MCAHTEFVLCDDSHAQMELKTNETKAARARVAELIETIARMRQEAEEPHHTSEEVLELRRL